MMYREDDFGNGPPPEAFKDFEKREIDNEWLRNADKDDQVAAMESWFYARFWDPAHETPCMSSEGGYLWTRGGPYDANDQLQSRFGDIASDEAIEEAVNSVQSGGIYDWAPTQLTYYDEWQDVDVDERNEPTQWLEERLKSIAGVLSLNGDDDARDTVRNLAYAGVIGALEAFLWETMAYWVDNQESTVVNLITKHPGFRDKPIKLGDIYTVIKQLKVEVKAHLQKVIWHRAESVAPLFKFGLGIDLGFKGFDEAVRKRHDIVHRFGHDHTGQPIQLKDEDVHALAKQVLDFANEVDKRIAGISSAVAEAVPANSVDYSDQL